MPFNSSYKDYDRVRCLNAREQLRGLAEVMVRDPLSTHVIETSKAEEKARYIVVDRAAMPDEGDTVLAATDDGLRVGIMLHAGARKNVWGKVTWVIQKK
jgi:hypothetical protein